MLIPSYSISQMSKNRNFIWQNYTFFYLIHVPCKVLSSGAQFKMVFYQSFICSWKNPMIAGNGNRSSRPFDKKRLFGQRSGSKKRCIHPFLEPGRCSSRKGADFLWSFHPVGDTLYSAVPNGDHTCHFFTGYRLCCNYGGCHTDLLWNFYKMFQMGIKHNKSIASKTNKI